MANIGAMPTGAELLAGLEVHGDYGEHARWAREGDDKVHLLVNVDAADLLATASVHAAYVYLERLNPIVVPYVNAFIAHTNQRVEKYWRTKSYRVVPFERQQTQDSLAANTRAAQALQLLAPRTQSDAEQMRAFANMLIRAAECLEAEEARRLEAERDKLKGQPLTKT